jgi:predicted nucleotidyltransferase/DNA-binding transcriptional ArsR family regulator
MALHDYVAEILGSKANVRVLRALVRYRGKVFTVRELARAADLSHPQASKVLKGLESRGVVRLQPIGRANQVSLNDESYVLKSVIEPLFAAEGDTVNSLASAIRPFFEDERIASVAIFGSVARGVEKETSDIDLLIIAEDSDLANERAAAATVASLSAFGHALSPLILDRKRFAKNGGGELEKSILAHYTLVYGIDPKEIVASGKTGR